MACLLELLAEGEMMVAKLGIADTMFARGDMASLAIKTIKQSPYVSQVEIVRYTVPGIKDLPVACKKLIEEKGCELVLAFGFVGKTEIDEQCGHEAAEGLIQAQLLTNKHVLGVFVHEREAPNNDKKLAEIMHDRAVKHTLNALDLLFAPENLQKKAGSAQRQGGKNAKVLEL